MQAHRVETMLAQEGTLVLTNLPFHAGDEVEVIVLPRTKPVPSPSYTLRGKPVVYHEPFAPVAENDWDATR